MSKLQQKSQLKCKEIKVKYVLWNYVENCNYSTNLRTYKKCIFLSSVSRVKTVLKMSYGYHHEPYGFCRFLNYFFVLQVLVLLSILSLLMGIYAILYLSV